MSRAPLPEARGSHVAAVIEINRAVAYSAKAASKERRRAKKIAKAKRKRAEKARERMTNAANTEPVTVGTRCYGSPLPEKVRNALRVACNEHGLLAVFNLINRAAPRRTRDAVVSAMTYVRDDRPSGRVHPFAKSWQRDFAIAAMILDRDGMPPAPESDSEIKWPPPIRREVLADTSPQRLSEDDDDPRFERISEEMDSMREEMAKVNASLRLLVGNHAESAPTPRTQREELVRFIRSVAKDDEEIELYFSELYAVAQRRWGTPWRSIADAAGYTGPRAPGDGWRLTVAEMAGRIAELSAIAHEIFDKR